MSGYKKSPKIPNNFSCDVCMYITCNKKDFSKHLDTIKHKKRTNSYKIVTNDYTFGNKFPKQFCCECGKSYNHRQNLYAHRKKCDFKNEKKIEIFEKNDEKNEDILDKFNKIIEKNNENYKIIEKNNENYKELFFKVIEQQNTIIKELIPKIGNNNNTINQKLNVNVFLNEQCKDAISLNDFVKNIEVSIKDLFLSKEKGLVKGISNLFIKHLNDLPLIQRPLWCSDKKRKKIYVKEDSWIEDIDNNKTKEAIYNISKIQTKNINKYICDKPDWMSNDVDKATYMDIVKSVTVPVDDSKKEKVIDSIIDVIHLTEDKIA